MPLQNFRRPKRPTGAGHLVSAIDIGSSKICCLIARLEDGTPRIIGIGHHVSKGVKSGNIIDLDAAQMAIGQAVQAAEQMAGVTLENVWINLCGGQPSSQILTSEIAISQAVTEADINRVHTQCLQNPALADKRTIHSIPLSYAIDDNRGIRYPLEMYGNKLSAQFHVVTAQENAVRNLTNCVERNHLEIDGLVISPYASGLSCLVEDEMELGVTVIDLGGGTTTFSVFFEGQNIYTDGLPIGGNHVTNDIARGLSTSVSYAERLKTLHGSAILNPLDEREILNIPLVGEDSATQNLQIPKSTLIAIIRPRLEELFELVKERLGASGFEREAGRRVVLTGGASQLPYIRELAQTILDRQIRLGRPNRLSGLPESVSSPAFATSIGLLQYGSQRHKEFSLFSEARLSFNVLGRFGQWLRENL